MRALQLVSWQRPLELRDVPKPTPGPGQVLVRVGGAGACRSDIAMMQWPPGTRDYPLPMTLGHETAGWIDELGDGVIGFERGDAIAIYNPWGCGTCPQCLQGAENYCQHAHLSQRRGAGVGFDGGMADYVLVPHTRFLIPLGDLDPSIAAPLTDAGMTPYHAINRVRAGLGEGAWVCVIGAGGLGHLSVQILGAITSAHVVVIERDTRRHRSIRADGADAVLADEPGSASAVRRLTAGRGCAAVLDFVGSTDTLSTGIASLAPLGQLVLVGLAGGSTPFAFSSLPKGASLTTSFFGTRPDLEAVLELARQGSIRPRIRHFGLDEATRAYKALADGDIEGRAVVIP